MEYVNKRDTIIAILSSAIPFAGNTITSFIISRIYGDFKEIIKYVILGLPITIGTTYYLLTNIFPKLEYYLLIIPVILPFPVSFILSRKNMAITYSEDVIEIKFKIPINMSARDPHELFEYVFNKALSKIKNPYYYNKLISVANCSGLKVSYISDDKLVIRRKCGDIDIRIIISSMKIADMVIDISY
ncbi:hypothetical protein BFU36_02770 [Sulfolobus sp. A20]|nr:hypothetical protein BFU36_02770 [Sulfolobus sp. A20]